MASQNEDGNESSHSLSKISCKIRGTNAVSPSISSSFSDDELECSNWYEKQRTDRNRAGVEHSTATNLPRREENSFSFKHFLKNDSQTNYQLAGARPKVYLPPTTSPEPSDHEAEAPGVYPRNPTELPDFVQDHLIVEQCYLTYEPTTDMENLPDFALNSIEQRQPRHWNEPKKCQSETPRDLQFDLTNSLDRGRRESSVTSTVPSTPLDLPTFDGTNQDSDERPHRFVGFPFDLQLSFVESACGNAPQNVRSCTPIDEMNVIKSLPDFLSDGPIRNNRTESPSDIGLASSVSDTTDRTIHLTSLLLDNEKLCHELEVVRRQVEEQSRRIQSLESELASRRVAVNHEEAAHLEKVRERAEDKMKRCTRRTVNAESTVTALKEEVKLLTAEVSTLRFENRKFRAGGPAAGRNDNGSTNNDVRIKRLASDLRAAASTAEVSLRQLMSGVDNLKVLASTLENVDRIEDRTKDFLPDFDEDNATGPAL